MRLQRLTGLEREKILEDYRKILQDIERFKKILASSVLVDEIIHGELQELIDLYGDPRRTDIVVEEREVNLEDLIDEKEVVVTITRAGYVKRTPLDVYRSQRRGGKGRTGMNIREKDVVTTVFTASTHDHLLVFTTLGRVYWLKVYTIPEVAPAAMGKAIVNLLPLMENERVATILPVRNFDDGRYVIMATRRGVVKKTELSAYSNPRPSGIRALVIDEGDEMICARITDGNQHLFFMSKAGKCIRIEEKDVRPTGRVTRGVRAMELAGSELIGMDLLSDDYAVLVVTERGYGKRTPAAAYKVQRRGGHGVINIRVTEKNGEVVAFRQVSEEDEILIITNSGRLIRIAVSEIREMGRATQGVKLMDLGDAEKVVDVAVLVESEEEREEEDQ
jgi:DNA gyrase subunit A